MITATADLHRITADIWSTVLGIDVEPGVVLEASSDRSLTGCVQITGDWEGAVTIECSETLARQAAATMFGMAPDEVSEEEIQDTIGELANMTGGSVKSLIPGSCALSLPTVTGGRDYHVTIRGSHVLERVTFGAAGEQLIVTTIERDGASPR